MVVLIYDPIWPLECGLCRTYPHTGWFLTVITHIQKCPPLYTIIHILIAILCKGMLKTLFKNPLYLMLWILKVRYIVGIVTGLYDLIHNTRLLTLFYIDKHCPVFRHLSVLIMCIPRRRLCL